jgi:hypothetical protein
VIRATFAASLMVSANDLRLGKRRSSPAILSLRTLFTFPPVSFNRFFRPSYITNTRRAEVLTGRWPWVPPRLPPWQLAAD